MHKSGLYYFYSYLILVPTDDTAPLIVLNGVHLNKTKKSTWTTSFFTH